MDQFPPQRLNRRAEVLRNFGATSPVVSELLAYNEEVFDHRNLGGIEFPLSDEEFVDEWHSYAQKAEKYGFQALAEHLVQLNFPICNGISKTAEYIAATRRGSDTHCIPIATGMSLKCPDECVVITHHTWAGHIPLIQANCREDFVSLVRALSYRNEPVEIPNSMGACIIEGYNNWSRFNKLRQQWINDNPGQVFSMKYVSSCKNLYQDRFMILSNDWYSGVPPEKLRLSDAEWRRISVVIRREHESAHYWTRRVLSSMRNNVVDEIIADYCGIVSAIGEFRPDWLMTFLGLEDFPQYREGGRLQNYRGTPPLTDAGFDVLKSLVASSAVNLERFYKHYTELLGGNTGILLALLTLTRFTLEEMASEFAIDLLSVEAERAQEIINQATVRPQ